MLQCDRNMFEEFINDSGLSYYVQVILPNYPSMVGFSLHASWNLKVILSEAVEQVNQFSTTCNGIEELSTAIKEIITAFNNKRQVPKPATYYQTILSELKLIGSSGQLMGNFEGVQFESIDSSSRIHRARISIPKLYPNSAVIVEEHELPIDVNSSLGHGFNNVKRITDFYSRFIELIEVFQPFWDAMEILDSSCWVLEPRNPLMLDPYRCIKISDDCSILLTFNPYNPSQIPRIDFRGVPNKVDSVRSIVETNLMENIWDPEADIYMNLLQLLNMETLPLKGDEVPEEEALLQVGDCAICFEERLDGRVANQHCDNGRCNSQYHQACLLRYLCGNLNNVRMKNAVLGRCPTCRDPIGCPLT